MAGLEDSLSNKKHTLADSVQSGLHPHIAKLYESQQAWKKSLHGFNMFNDIAKALRHQQLPANVYLSSMSSLRDWAKISKAMQPNPAIASFSVAYLKERMISPAASISSVMQAAISGFRRHHVFSRRNLPDATIAAIGGIGRQYHLIFSQFRLASEILQKVSIRHPFPGIDTALFGLTWQVASASAKKGRWDLIDDIEEISNNAVAIGENIAEKEIITKEDVEAIKAFLERIETNVNEKDKSLAAILIKWMGIIGFILAIIAEARNYIPRPEAATKQDIEQLVKEIQGKTETKLCEHNDSVITNRLCNIRFKPFPKSRSFTQLPEACSVVILATNGKWAYVSYANPKDSLTETGWVLKKYLSNTAKKTR